LANVSDDAQLVAEFDAFVTRAQLPVPAERREGLIAAYAEMRSMLAVLREQLPVATEPASVFRVSDVPGLEQ
jgi:hypothetical protein